MAYGHPDWQLRANPFPYGSRPLSPLAEPTQLSYYFDFYDWRDPARAADLDGHGRVRVFQLGSQPTTTFLISGPTGCGRSSLENLLLYEVSRRFEADPVIVRQKLSVGASANFTRGTMLVQDLEDEVRQRDEAAADALMAAFDRWQRLTVAGTQPDVTNLLNRIRRSIGQSLPGAPIIVSFDGLDHTLSYDTGFDAVDMVQDFADVAILSVTVPDYASYVRSRFSSSQRPVAWINAPRVREPAFREYVERRVSAERDDGPAPPFPSFPVSTDAITTIFAAADGPGPVELPIRLAIQKLVAAMEDKLRTTVAGQSPSAVLDADDIRRSFARA